MLLIRGAWTNVLDMCEGDDVFNVKKGSREIKLQLA